MKNAKKALILVLCAALLVGASVMGTLAYLQMQTQTVTNTFTVGNVKITMDEAKVDEYGDEVDGTRIDVTNAALSHTYKLIPGREYVKDPVIRVTADSEACWLFVKVENGIVDYEAGTTGTTITEQLIANGWTALTGFSGVYYIYVDADTAEAGEDYNVFESFTIKNTLTNDQLAAIPAKTKILVTAYAIQADGFGDAATAWRNGNFS